MQDTDTLKMLTDEVKKVTYNENIDVDKPIGELGVDSMRVVELILICGQLYGGTIHPEELDVDHFTTLRELDRQFREMAERTQQSQDSASG